MDDKSSRVSLEAAQKTTVPTPKPDKTAADEQKFFAHEENMQNAQLGWIGKIWGARTEKPDNVSAIIGIVLTVYLGVLIFWYPDNSQFSDIFSGITSIITLILGYLFGSSDRR